MLIKQCSETANVSKHQSVPMGKGHKIFKPYRGKLALGKYIYLTSNIVLNIHSVVIGLCHTLMALLVALCCQSDVAYIQTFINLYCVYV